MRNIITKLIFFMLLVISSISLGCSTPQKEPDYDKVRDNADKGIMGLEREQK